ISGKEGWEYCNNKNSVSTWLLSHCVRRATTPTKEYSEFTALQPPLFISSHKLFPRTTHYRLPGRSTDTTSSKRYSRTVAEKNKTTPWSSAVLRRWKLDAVCETPS
ncbi:hypothetical protein GWI33_002613, partial [Rhynchophorus ferrugineus]